MASEEGGVSSGVGAGLPATAGANGAGDLDGGAETSSIESIVGLVTRRLAPAACLVMENP